MSQMQSTPTSAGRQYVQQGVWRSISSPLIVAESPFPSSLFINFVEFDLVAAARGSPVSYDPHEVSIALRMQLPQFRSVGDFGFSASIEHGA